MVKKGKVQRALERKAKRLYERSRDPVSERVIDDKTLYEAAKVAKRLVRAFPVSKLGWGILIAYHTRMENFIEQRRCCLEYAKASPKEHSLWELKKMARTYKFYDALEYNRKGRPRTALRLLQEILEFDPYISRHNTEQALLTAVEHHMLRPGREVYLIEVTNSLVQLERWHEAALINYGIYQKNPFYLPAIYNCIDTMRMLKDARWRPLLDVIVREVIEYYPDDVRLLAYRGQTLYEKGRFKASKKYLERAQDNFARDFWT